MGRSPSGRLRTLCAPYQQLKVAEKDRHIRKTLTQQGVAFRIWWWIDDDDTYTSIILYYYNAMSIIVQYYNVIKIKRHSRRILLL